MRVERIRLVNFRSFEHKEISPADVTLLVGPNASGKTNLIEAVRLATATSSFRRPHMWQVVREGASGATVEVEASGNSSHVEVVMDVQADGRRSYIVNGSAKRRLSEVAPLIPSVVFTPDDLGLVKDSADTRREALDGIGATLWSTYGKLSSDYSRAVRQRNRLLRDGAQGNRIEPWTEQVTAMGGRLLSLRTRLLGRIMPAVLDAYATISAGESLEIEYADSLGMERGAWEQGVDADEARDAIRRTLEHRNAEELRRATTLAGPHRDDVVFSIRERDARAFASQGQQRSIALAWKVGELRTLQDVTSRRPILLLDDVMSELDERRRTALASLVGDETQTLITTTNLGYFDEETLRRAEVVGLP